MKKLMSLILTLMLLLSAAMTDVLMPNGVEVGMTVDQVIAIEGVEPTHRSIGLSNYELGEGVVFFDVTYSRYPATRTYMMKGDGLFFVYNLVQVQGAYDSLTQTLTSAYGPGSTLTFEQENRFKMMCNDGVLSDGGISIIRMHQWQMNESTIIWMREYTVLSNGKIFTSVEYIPANWADVIHGDRENGPADDLTGL